MGVVRATSGGFGAGSLPDGAGHWAGTGRNAMGAAISCEARTTSSQEGAEDLFEGTFLPARRASEIPMATACFGFVTFLPEPPERRSPRFHSCMTFATLALAPLLYLRAPADLLLAMR